MPAAALGLKKYLAGTTPSSTSANDEDTPPPLGHSEVSAVQHSPGEVVKPELGQRRENDGEISSVVGGKKSGNVLNEDPSAWTDQSVSDSCELEEEAGSLSGEESCASSGDGEVLAGEAAAQEVDGMNTASVLFFTSARAVPGLSSIHCRDLPRQLSSFDPPACQSKVNGSHVVVDEDSGEPCGEDSAAPLVGLAEERVPEACGGEPVVESADAGEG